MAEGDGKATVAIKVNGFFKARRAFLSLSWVESGRGRA